MTESRFDGSAREGARRDVATSPAFGDAPYAATHHYDLLQVKLARAAADLEAGESFGRTDYLESASAIVFDLLYSLDFKRGGVLAARLATLYGYIGNELLDVARTRNRDQLEQLRDMVTTLKGSWDQPSRVA